MSEALLNEEVTVNLPKPKFRAVVQNGGLQNLPEYMDAAELSGRVFILTDENVKALYGDGIEGILTDNNVEAKVLTPMPAGEKHKTKEQFDRFIDNLSEENATRSDIIMALGGGVVGDLVGYVGASWNRGMPVVQVPTTLLAQVDSSIGGKTGIDQGGKNKVGAIRQPRLIVADPDTLATLEPRVYTEGLGEVAKYGMLNEAFFLLLDDQAELVRDISPEGLAAMGRIIARCAMYKIDVIADDPEEKNPSGGRLFLNYGHTLGHGLEAAGGYGKLLHGEAVATGMMFAAGLAVEQGVAEDEGIVAKQEALLRKLGMGEFIQYSGEADLDTILANMKKDKKNKGGGNISFVLPRTIGHMVARQVSQEDARTSVAKFLAA